MQQITFEIDAQRVGRASGYIGGLTVEQYTFTGAAIPTGTRLAILTRAGNTIAAAEIAEGNTAEVDTNTQEVADLLRYQPIGTCETVYITLGDADNILAIIPATMRKNWLDDEATHPPVPANRYPTKTELDQWLARFDDRASATAAAQSAAEAAASAARNSATTASDHATAAKTSADNARLSAKVANASATEADEYKRSAETAQAKAETAQQSAETAATAASNSAEVAAASEQTALAAKGAAETAQGQAKASETAAKASENAAKESEMAASAAEEEAGISEQAAAKSATAAAESATSASSSATAANASATSASSSATAANASANAASSSASAAAKSAAAAASSASAAKQSETDLADAVATAEGLDGRLVDVERGLANVRSTYLPLTGGTVKGTLSVDTSNVIDRPVLDLKVHMNQDDPYRSLIVIRDETGNEFASIKVKRAESSPAYNSQIYIESEFLSTKLLNTSKGFYGPYGVAPTTGRWADAGGAWKFDLIKGEIAITNNGWDCDENAMPASKTFLKFTEIATTEKINAATEKILNGKGAYVIQSRDVVPNGKPTSADVGKVIYFDGVDAETTSTLKVMNRVPFAQKVCPAPIASNEPSMCAVGCFDYVRNKKYIVFMTSLSLIPIGYLYQLNVSTYSVSLTFKSKLEDSGSWAGSNVVAPNGWSHLLCIHDGYAFYTASYYSHGPYVVVCDIETGKKVVYLDLDPLDIGGIYPHSAIWYNPLSGHICVLSYAHSLPTGETWGGAMNYTGNSHFIRVFNWNSDTRTLSDIPSGDSPVTMVDVTDAVTEGLSGTKWNGYGSTWPIRDQVFLSISGANYTALFHATADDRIEPCYEWDVEYAVDESGVTRPVWQTREEEWTDAEGNTKVIQNYVRNNRWDYALVPKMTKGRLLKFLCNASYEGVPSGTWSANPVFYHNVYSFCESYENAAEGFKPWWGGTPQSFVKLTDGVKRWIVMDGNKLVDINAFNTLTHMKAPPNPDANGKPLEEWIPRDAETGVYLIGDIRKGGTQKFTGWLPKSGNYLASVGSVTGSHTHEISCITQLTAAQSGTPLSRLGMVKNIGTDSAAMTPLPMTGTYSADWWIASMLPYCAFGFFGNVWMTSYNKTIGGRL